MAAEQYAELIRRWKEANLLATTSALLEWEQQTYMPARAAEYRAEQISLLAGLHHDRVTAPEIGELLGELEANPPSTDPLAPEAVNVREIRRDYDKSTKLPKKLVEELARTTSIAQQEWAAARKANDFAKFEPWLAKIYELKRQQAAAVDPKAKPYDALMDDFETGASIDQIQKLFANLRDELVQLVAATQSATKQPDHTLLERNFPVDRQQIFGEMAAGDIGYDFSRGRLDQTTHPFCTTLGPNDCRILTRYNARHFNESFFGTLHEAGHAMYEQGLDAEHFGTPMGEAVSLGVHESQSRLWENEVGRSFEFWKHYFPKAKAVFREALSDVALDAFHFAINRVAPSFIRVEADEVTYNLHILIRFELEQALLAGDLPTKDLPGVWNEKYQKYLGITPPTEALGCLQDIHWSAGLIGYFPTYTLGNVYGAQMFAKARKDIPGLEEGLSRGDFSPLLDWLRTNVHRHGKRYLPADLVKEATGAAPSHEPLIALLHDRFDPLYGL